MQQHPVLCGTLPVSERSEIALYEELVPLSALTATVASVCRFATASETPPLAVIMMTAATVVVVSGWTEKRSWRNSWRR